jgi:hypothetical protein
MIEMQSQRMISMNVLGRAWIEAVLLRGDQVEVPGEENQSLIVSNEIRNTGKHGSLLCAFVNRGKMQVNKHHRLVLREGRHNHAPARVYDRDPGGLRATDQTPTEHRDYATCCRIVVEAAKQPDAGNSSHMSLKSLSVPCVS